jgi:hypothetical protein
MQKMLFIYAKMKHLPALNSIFNILTIQPEINFIHSKALPTRVSILFRPHSAQLGMIYAAIANSCISL